MRFRVRRLRLYVANVADPDGLRAHQFTLRAPSLRRARAYASQWAAEDGFPTVLSVRPDDQRPRSLVRVAGMTAAVSGCSLTTIMVASLWVQGAL